MSFVQVIECRTSKPDELRRLDAEWEKATEGRRTLRRQIVTQDRNAAGRYLVFCFFDSYASAMENSSLPETVAGAARYARAMDAPPRFLDLDVVEDRVLDEAAAAKAGFVQVVEVRTARFEEMSRLDREYEAGLGPRTTVRRSLVTRDRADSEHHYVLVFFDSYESAMTNSNLPETATLAEKAAAVLGAPPVFHDLDVVEDRLLA